MNSFFGFSSFWLHSNCCERERRKIDEARGGGASGHPSTTKFSDLFALTPIFIRPEANGEQTQVWERTIQYSVMQCSVEQYSTIQYSTDMNVFTGKKGLVL